MQEHSKKIQELSNFLLDYATTLMAVGSHTSRIVKNVTRIAESFGFGVDMTIFQRNITMTVKHSEDYSIRRTYVRRIPAMALTFRTISDLSALSWEAYYHHPGLHYLQLRFNTKRHITLSCHIKALPSKHITDILHPYYMLYLFALQAQCQ